MSLTLHYHPLASFCWKALIALYENDTPFERVIVDLGDTASRDAFYALWPIGNMPVLQDSASGVTVGESTIVVDYLETHHPGRTALLPANEDAVRDVRFWDRVYDTYVQEPMQKIVLDRLRPEGKGDAFGVEAAKGQLREMYGFLDKALEGRRWAAGDGFTLADCSAAPALFYAGTIIPFEPGQRNLAGYFDRLAARPSFRRVLEEAEPYFKNFPLEKKPQLPTRRLLI
jgi:glutathione S-transferase